LLRDAQAMGGQWSYAGVELESMIFAVNYRRWIFDIFRPYLGKRIVEVGAGLGTFSQLLLETRPERLDAIEPSADLYLQLSRILPRADEGSAPCAYRGTLREHADAIRKAGAPDSVVYVNVLEHIEDDVNELFTTHALLQEAGHILIFCPAHPWLMGSMDRQLGHYRRYTMAELVEKCQAAGFEIRLASYFDMLGIVPWWLKYCVLQSRSMEPPAVRFYDRYVVPLSRLLESVISPPIGRNVVLVGQRANR
jgi:SAM-dependent methyltransferase